MNQRYSGRLCARRCRGVASHRCDRRTDVVINFQRVPCSTPPRFGLLTTNRYRRKYTGCLPLSSKEFNEECKRNRGRVTVLEWKLRVRQFFNNKQLKLPTRQLSFSYAQEQNNSIIIEALLNTITCAYYLRIVFTKLSQLLLFQLS